MPYYFYLARCADDTLYSGYTVNIKEREQRHNEGRGARYTKARRPVKIVYSEEYQTKSEAMKREYEVNQWTKNQKMDLLTNT